MITAPVQGARPTPSQLESGSRRLPTHPIDTSLPSAVDTVRDAIIPRVVPLLAAAGSLIAALPAKVASLSRRVVTPARESVPEIDVESQAGFPFFDETDAA